MVAFANDKYKFVNPAQAGLVIGLLVGLASCTTGNGLGGISQIDPAMPTASVQAHKTAIEKLKVKLVQQRAKILKQQSKSKIIVANLRPVVESETGNVRVRDNSVKNLITTSITRKFDDPGRRVQGSKNIALIPRLQSISHGGGPLGRFHAKLTALKSGSRRQAITILHIGDSHIASDSFSRGIRTALQSRYGDAGRGMVIPAKAYKYGVADQIKFSTSGNWHSQTALKNKRGQFGIAGVSVTSRSSRSSLKLTSQNGSFDWAAVSVATGPSQGAFTMKVGNVSQKFNAYSKHRGSKMFRVNSKARSMIIKPAGGARTTVLNWSTGKNRPGIRYVNFGLIGATLDITKRFNRGLVANDVRRLDPDLIIYGYGTNEGFNDHLNLSKYRKQLVQYMKLLKKSAPNADVVYLGAASGLRKRGNKKCGAWSTPPKLEPLRRSMRQLAHDQQAAYWDWAQAMGGECAINKWAKLRLAAKDRVHLSSKGYSISAQAFTKWLVAPKLSNKVVASN